MKKLKLLSSLSALLLVLSVGACDRNVTEDSSSDEVTSSESDSSSSESTPAHMTVYDVGETDKRETVEYYHNGLQASINGSN